MSIEEHYADIQVPALHIGGWYDIFLTGTLRNYIGIKAHGGSDAARNGQREGAARCLAEGAAKVLSFEKNPDVIWLRGLNPWSPAADRRLDFAQGDCAVAVALLPDRSVDAVLHDPPRFGIAGELYSAAFYAQLARVLVRRGALFHYNDHGFCCLQNLPAHQNGVSRVRVAGLRRAPDAVRDGGLHR